MKVLIWIALGFALVTWLLRSKKPGSSPSAGQAPQPPSPQAEQMLQCRYCGTHVPASEAVVHAAGSPFCSEEHRRLHLSS